MRRAYIYGSPRKARASPKTRLWYSYTRCTLRRSSAGIMLRHRQLCLALLCLGLSSFVALVILQHQLDDFMRPLSHLNLGKPDKDFAEWWSGECSSYGLQSAGGDCPRFVGLTVQEAAASKCFTYCPHFARWTVQEAAGKRRHRYPLDGVTEGA